MIHWNVPTAEFSMPMRALNCPLNQGVVDEFGNRIHYSSRIWVNDILIAAVGITNMKMALAAVIKAIFTVLGQPDIAKR